MRLQEVIKEVDSSNNKIHSFMIVLKKDTSVPFLLSQDPHH